MPKSSGCGVVSGAQFPVRQYFYVSTKMSWYDAQSYCREKYTDLAIFENMADIQRVVKPATYAWIGLYDDQTAWKGIMGNKTNSWRWSATGQTSQTGYQAFNTPTEPNYVAAAELCVIMTTIGKWHDVNCADLNFFVCFTGEFPFNLSGYTLNKFSSVFLCVFFF